MQPTVMADEAQMPHQLDAPTWFSLTWFGLRWDDDGEIGPCFVRHQPFNLFTWRELT
jgi:hypothetical protein